MRRLISGFGGRTYHIVGNLMHWLNYVFFRFPMEIYNYVIFPLKNLDHLGSKASGDSFESGKIF